MKQNKKYIIFFLLNIFIAFFLFSNSISSQVPGEWTWMNGSQTTNGAGSYGIKGVANPTNEPSAEYEALEWTDNFGNFWIYGGANNATCFSDNLWKFDVSIKQWIWMQGSAGTGSLSAPIYGTRGIPSASNTPGFRTTGYTWTDNNGKLWLYGGFGYVSPCAGQAYSDLWKYDPITNMWAWMKGPQGASIPGNYGIKGVEDTINNPNFIGEMGVSWTDNSGDLWLLDTRGCLWKYRIATNNWIWINGNNTPSSPNPVYGTKGIAATNNTPGGAFFDYTRWKDSKGDFWYLYSRSGGLKVMWNYNVSSNMWTWTSGDTISSTLSYYGASQCDPNSLNINPKPRLEARTCWIDPCDNLWVFGGYNGTASSNPVLNDLLFYRTTDNTWVWADNNSVQTISSNYGTIGISSPSNMPNSRQGSAPFTDNLGNFWFFGGLDYTSTKMYSDLWRYMPDTSCTKCNSLVTIINSLDINKDVLIAPNPSSGLFKISFALPIENVLVLDYFGNLIKQEFFQNKKRIEISIENEGIYFLQIKSGNKKTIRKVIVAK